MHLNQNIQTVLDNFTKIDLKDNEFLHKTLDYKSKIELGIFGKNKNPCIAVIVNERFKKYNKYEKFKILNILNTFDNRGQKILIILKDKKRFDIFQRFYNWLCEDIKDNNLILKTYKDFINYIDQFSILFEKIKEEKLSKERVIGLFGELNTILELIKNKKYKSLDIINSWQGFSRSKHDFVLNKLELEIKTSLNEDYKIHCSSYDQLISDNGKKTYLIHQIIKKIYNNEEGLTIHELIKKIKAQLKDQKAEKIFQRKLELFNLENLKNKDKYQIKFTNIYNINDQFPSLKFHEFHESLSNIKYQIDLKLCQDWITDLELNGL